MGTAGSAAASATAAAAAARAVRGGKQLVHEQPECEQLVREQFRLPECRNHCSVGWRFVQVEMTTNNNDNDSEDIRS